MTDVSDRATQQEELARQIGLSAAIGRESPDMEAIVCEGCNYVTKSCYGKTCEAYPECLHDVSRLRGRNVS